jgi:hypothetical protein
MIQFFKKTVSKFWQEHLDKVQTAKYSNFENIRFAIDTETDSTMHDRILCIGAVAIK